MFEVIIYSRNTIPFYRLWFDLAGKLTLTSHTRRGYLVHKPQGDALKHQKGMPSHTIRACLHTLGDALHTKPTELLVSI